MKSLHLVRHAKSSWDDLSVSDFDRPLNERGRKSAAFMAKRWLESDKPLNLIVSSPAKRALDTARIVAHGLEHLEVTLTTDANIYEAHVNDLLEVVNSISDDVHHVMLIGHNPSMSQLVEFLSGEAVELPTCAMVEIILDIDSWKEVSRGLGSFKSLDYPKKYQEFI